MKVNCPFCQHHTLSIKPDDSLAKCFHVSCGRFITPHSNAETITLATVLADIYHNFHQELLQLTQAKYFSAYQYLVEYRHIHPRVVQDSMLGAVPSGGYDLTAHFQPLKDAIQSTGANAPKPRGRPKEGRRLTADDRLQWLAEQEEKLRACLLKHAGWLAFFYTDARHHIVAIRFRKPQPETKDFRYFKPYKTVAGLFGHGLFAPYETNGEQAYNEHLIVTEGEFNSLQLQSAYVRQMEARGKPPGGYLYACSVGGADNTDWASIAALVKTPILAYDDDAAGRAWLEQGREVMGVMAFTTPAPHKDLDAYICSFHDHAVDAWSAVKSLVKQRKPYYRLYSGTGAEFFEGRRFVPKRLAEAIMERYHLKYSAEILWVYQDGVYRPGGEQAVKAEAQALLGERRQEGHIQETLRYIEVASYSDPPTLNPDVINLQNGRLHWRTRTLEPHTPDVFEIVQLPFSYDDTAPCPTFDRYCETTFCDDDEKVREDVIQLVDELIGNVSIPDTRHEKATMLVGEGMNGKSVLIDTITALLGFDNVSHVALQDLEENRFRVAELFGKLGNFFADLDMRALRSSSMFKTLVTGDRITAERKFGQPFTFANYARLIFSCNRMPTSFDKTYAYYRRWIIIPFTKTFKGDAADKDLRAKLQKELPGIFNRALNGLQRLSDNGAFTVPQVVQDALAAYQRDNDTVAAFIEACVAAEELGHVRKSVFYSTYQAWCRQQGLKAMRQNDVRDALYRMFPSPPLDEWREDNGKGPWNWKGIRLTEDAPKLYDEQQTDYFSGNG
jgi:putative DNA primase/helicase